MKLALRILAALALAATFAPAEAGIPVIDVANLAQSVQQVIAWGQQYGQMTESINQLRNQYAQLANTYAALTGNRGLGTLLNTPIDQAARRYLPADALQLGQLASGTVTGFASLQTTINRYRSSVSAMPTTTFPVGSSAAGALAARIDTLATQQALAESAYSANDQRTADLESMIATIGSANDPKAIAEINARIAAQQALIGNETTRLQALAHLQQVEQQRNEQRGREVIAKWGTATLPPISF